MSAEHSPGATDGQQQDGQRLSLYTPQGLTVQETELLRKLRHEATWTRGYPYALMLGGACLIATRRRTMTVKVVATSLGGIIGNITGKLSYLPTISQRILSDLPESSPLRQKVEEARAAGGLTQFGMPAAATSTVKDDHDMQFDTGSTYDPKDFDPHTQTPSPSKKYITYDELRKRHREGEDTKPLVQGYTWLDGLNVGQQVTQEPSTDNGTPQVPTPPQATDEFAPQTKVRYNKYGDPITE